MSSYRQGFPRVVAGLIGLTALTMGPGSTRAFASPRAGTGIAFAEREPADSPTVRLTLEQLKAKLSTAGAEGPDLSKVNLSGLDLSGIDFKRANLTGAWFTN